MGTLFVFVDGLGFAPPGPENPLSPPEAWPDAHGLPRLARLLGAPLAGAQGAAGLAFAGPGGRTALALVDATLGVPGLPQSGTGQAALFGGFNAALIEGRHVPAFPTVAIRDRLREANSFLDALRAGRPPAFLNAFREGALVPRGRHRHLSCSVVAFATTGLPFRGLEDLLAGRAVAFDITGAALRGEPIPGWPRGRRAQPGAPEPEIPAVAPEEAGARAAREALRTPGFALFEYFLTDLAGHAGDPAFAREALERLDRFLAGAAEVLVRADGRLLLASDHGNVEDLASRGHTRNPVPLLALGPGADQALGQAQSIVDVRRILAAWT